MGWLADRFAMPLRASATKEIAPSPMRAANFSVTSSRIGAPAATDERAQSENSSGILRP